MSDDAAGRFDPAEPFGGKPLHEWPNLSELAGLKLTAPEPTQPLRLPDLPQCLTPVDWEEMTGPGCRLYRQERAAAQAEIDDKWRRSVLIDGALGLARRGRLAEDWREQGLNEALAKNRSGDVAIWMKIGGMSGRYWEPRVLAWYAGAVGWQHALGQWHADCVWGLWDREMYDPGSPSRWAGIDLVHADIAAWESALDQQDQWPDTLAVHRPWTDGIRAHWLRMRLDRFQLSYEVGMAYGGAAIDWRGEHAQRVARWRAPGDRDAELARLKTMTVDSPTHRLPIAWLIPGIF